MAAKAIVALLVLGWLPALGQSPPDYTWPQHPRLTWAAPPAEIHLLPKRIVGHRFQVPACLLAGPQRWGQAQWIACLKRTHGKKRHVCATRAGLSRRCP